MTILCDRDLKLLMQDGLIQNPDYSLVNPASIDIRLGAKVYRELGHGDFQALRIDDGLVVAPGEFVLISTYEYICVPNGYAMDLRLKSSTARLGWDHSLAFWVDPGWKGVLTMEIRNVLRYNSLTLTPGMRFAQAIVHMLSGPSDIPYQGRYQFATSVEAAKSSK